MIPRAKIDASVTAVISLSRCVLASSRDVTLYYTGKHIQLSRGKHPAKQTNAVTRMNVKAVEAGMGASEDRLDRFFELLRMNRNTSTAAG